MKRVCAVLLSCSIVASSFTTYNYAFAVNESTEASSQYLSAEPASEVTYSEAVINGNKLNLRNVNVTFNGEPIKSEVSPMLYENRTLVPLRFIAEATGAEVEWNKENQGITVKTPEKTIYLEIDSSDVMVNGISKAIDYSVTPKLIDSTTMVPLRFISEEIGCLVDWNEERFSANIEYSQLGNTSRKVEIADITTSSLSEDILSFINISLSSNSSPRVYSLSENPKKIIVDIPNSSLKIDGTERTHFESYLNKAPVESIIASQIDKRSVRVTVNLTEETEFTSSFDGRDVKINFPNVTVPQKPSIVHNSLDKFSVENIDGKEAILLHNTSNVDFKHFKLSGNPARVVLDLRNTVLNTSDDKVPSSTVSGIRFSQYENPAEYPKDELVTRVVLDLKKDLSKFSYSTKKIGNNIAVFINDESPSLPPVNPELPDYTPTLPEENENPETETTTYTAYNMTIEEMIAAQSKKLTVTDKYRNSPAYIHKSYIDTVDGKFGKINETTVDVKSDTNGLSFSYGQLKKGAFVTILSTSGDWYKIQYSSWRNANADDIRYYLNPDNFPISSPSAFQFLDLSKTSGISALELDSKVLVNRGILSKKGQSFIEAGKKYSVNEIYLVAHAFLETGNGSSQLSKGVIVSSVDGKAVTPRTVYNMFGIGATDANALKYGSERAYKEGWFTPEEAIVGGAKFISEKYIKNGQNTLYEMRWNPDINKVWHQYATDIGWAHKQVNSMKSLYDSCSGYTLKYDIPVYKK